MTGQCSFSPSGSLIAPRSRAAIGQGAATQSPGRLLRGKAHERRIPRNRTGRAGIPGRKVTGVLHAFSSEEFIVVTLHASLHTEKGRVTGGAAMEPDNHTPANTTKTQKPGSVASQWEGKENPLFLFGMGAAAAAGYFYSNVVFSQLDYGLGSRPLPTSFLL